MTELAKCPSLEHSGSEEPDSESFRVKDLVVEVDMDPVLVEGHQNAEVVEKAWEKLLQKIRWYLGRSTSVIVRGWTNALDINFSKR